MMKRILYLLFVVAILLFSFPQDVQAGISKPPGQASGFSTSFTFADLGESDIYAREINDQFSIVFPLPAGLSVEQAFLKIHLSHGKKLLPELSDMMIALNDEPLLDIILSEENSRDYYADIELPAAAFIPGDNKLIFRTNLRLFTKGCDDLGDSSLWVKVFADSVLNIEGSEIPLEPDLSLYPYPFTSFSALYPKNLITIVIPDDPTSAEMSIATQITARLGQVAKWDVPPLHMTTYGELTDTQAETDHLIIINTRDRNPLASGTSAGVSEIVSPFNANRLALVVSGNDDLTLQQVASMLSTQSARSMLSGSYVAPGVVKPLADPKMETKSTFQKLGFETKRVRGIGGHDLYYPIDVPYDWKTTGDAFVEIHFTHSTDLQDKSFMTASINGFKAADVSLTRINSLDGRLVIKLSPRQIRPGRNWLHLNFQLFLKQADCKFRYLEEAWVEINAENTFINLAHVNSYPLLELRYLPSPLVSPADLSATLFVLSDHPMSSELTAMARLAALLATHSKSDTFLSQAVIAGNFSEQIAKGKNIIAFGTPETNTLIEDYDENLPQSLKIVDGKIVPASGRELLPAEIEGQAGYFQMLSSPWSANTTFVVVSAINPDMFITVVDTFPRLGERLKKQGNVLIVTPNEIKGLNLGGVASMPLPDSSRFLLSTILFITFIAFGGIGLAIRWRNNLKKPKEDKKHLDYEEE